MKYHRRQKKAKKPDTYDEWLQKIKDEEAKIRDEKNKIKEEQRIKKLEEEEK